MKVIALIGSLLILPLVLPSLASAKILIPLTPADLQARTADFVQAPWNGKATNKGTTNDNGCLMATYTIQVDDPVTQTTKSYDVDVQAPAGAKTPVPVVVIVPTIEGTQPLLEPRVARSLCDAGIGSILADVNNVTQPKQYPAWEAEDANDRNAILALRTVVDLAERIPRFNRNKIGAMGLSLGGITTAMFAGLEPRLKASVVVVGGGNLPYILAHSDEGRMDTLRVNRMKAAGLTTVDQYEDKLRTTIKYDPFYFAPLVPRENVMMVMAESDVKVPYVVQREQFAAFGKPQSLTFTGGHVSTIIQMVYLYMGDVTDYFNKRFSSAPAMLALPAPITHKVVNLDDLGL